MKKRVTLIQFLIVAFPVGLVLLGAGSILRTHFLAPERSLDPNEEIRLQAAAMSRRPVNRADLESHVETLAGRIGERHPGRPGSLESAAAWIESTLGTGNIGYQVRRHSYDVGEREMHNLVAELPGRRFRREIVLVGAHYDTAPGSPGANDNATGVAAVLALARALAGDPQDRTVRFAAFANEDPSHSQTGPAGSLAYAQASRARGERIVAMVSLDSIGRPAGDPGGRRRPGEGGESGSLAGLLPEAGDSIVFVANEGSRFLGDSGSAAFETASGIPAAAATLPGDAPEAAWSDHWSFWQAGYPAVLVTHAAAFSHPHNRSSEDIPGAIDFEALEETVRGIQAVVELWANP